MGAFHEYELPGEDLILKGLEDLKLGHKTVESLLICIAQPRLQACGLLFTPLKLDDFAEMHLYKLLAESDSDTAHARMNAYILRLVSFENALERITPKPTAEYS
ncbi:MAG: hypothetical protein WCK42_04355 [Myxococcaceae bacterium]